MKIRQSWAVLGVAAAITLGAAPASQAAGGTVKHPAVTSPTPAAPRSTTEAAALLTGNAFSVATDESYDFPVTPGTHFHSNDAQDLDTGPDFLEVGQFCNPQTEACEEIRGLVEFDVEAGFVVDSATLQVEMLQAGGLFQQPAPGQMIVEITAYEGNNEENLSDYEIGTIEFVAEFDFDSYEVGERILIDVTELWNDASELGYESLGFRFQAVDVSYGDAVVYGNAAIELIQNNNPDPLGLDFAVMPGTVEVGETVTATWESRGADACEASDGLPGWAGDKDLSGSQQFTPQQTGRFSFRISCSQFIVSISRTAFLDVVAPPPEPGPDVTLTAASSSVPLGGLIDLSWTAEDAVSCTASSGLGGFNGSRDTSGSELLDATVAGLAQFKLVCRDAEGLKDTATVAVEVNGSDPDLFIRSFAPNRDEQTVGGPIGFNLLVGNDGNGASGATTVRYFLSDNATVTPSDTLIATVNLGTVPVGGSVTANNLNVAAPSVAGRYWLGGCISAAPGETNLANNCTNAVPVVISANAACAETATACGAVVGGGLGIQDCQGGPRGAGFPASKQVIDVGAGQELAFEAEWLDGMDGFISLQAPDGGPFVASNDDFGATDRSRLEVVTEEAGEYTLWVTSFEPGADGAFEVTTTCGDGAPDIVPRFVSSPETALVDQSVELRFDYENQGESESGSGFLTLRVSPDSVIDPDDGFSSETPITGLSVGGTGSHTFTGRFREPGNYWMGACVEASGDAELFTANNCSNARLLVVRNPADCSGGDLGIGESESGEVLEGDCDASPRGAGFPSRSHRFTGQKGQLVATEVSWEEWDGYLYIEGPDGRIVGQADDATTGFFTARLAGDSPGHGGLKGWRVPGDDQTLADEGSSGLTVELPADGEYTVWLTGFQPRTKGGYDLSLSEVQSSGPVFETTGLSLNKTTVDAGGQAVATLGLQDIGGPASYEAEVFFFLSSNNTLSEQDQLFARRVSGSFGSGSATEVNAYVPAPQSPGTYWVGACARPLGSDSGASVDGLCELSTLEVTSDEDRIAFNPGLNDTWFNPQTDGQGFFLEIFPELGSVFLTWFTYDTDGTPLEVSANIGDEGHRWLTAQGAYDESGASLNVTVTRGGRFASTQSVSRSTDGTMRLEFLGCDSGVISYDIPAESSGRLQGTIPIQRVVKDNVFLCENFLQEAPQGGAQAVLAASRAEVDAGEPVTVVWRAPDGMSCRPDATAGTPADWAGATLAGAHGALRLSVPGAGEHRLKMKCKSGDGRSAGAEAVVKARPSGSVTEATEPEIVVNEGLNDAWVDPDFNGQGLLINVFPELDTVFAAWFIFDNFDAGNANADIGAPGHRWVTAYGPVIGNTAELDVTLTRGGAFDERNPRPQTTTGYGKLNLSFDSCDAISGSYDIPSAGESGDLNLVRVTQDRVPNCVTKSSPGPDEGRLQEPDDKERLKNLCDGSVDWVFQWESSPTYNRYQFQVRQASDEEPRVDELLDTNRYRVTKSSEIPEGQLDGWTWRVRPVRVLPQAVITGPWSEHEFSVRSPGDCN